MSTQSPAPATPSKRLGLLSRLTGGSLALILLAAPLDYACTRELPLRLLSIALHVLACLWIMALCVEKRTPRIPTRTLWVAAVLLVFIWVRYACFEPAHIDGFTQEHFKKITDRWPESIIQRTPEAITLLASGLTLTLLVAADLGHRRLWRKIFAGSMVLSALIVVVVGLGQNYLHTRGIYGEIPHRNMPSPFFGTFYHFTSAGAFINLTWPLAACLTGSAIATRLSEPAPRWPLFLWLVACAGLLIGHTGHVSRFPQLIAACILSGLILLFRPWKHFRLNRTQALISVSAAIVLLAATVWAVTKVGRIDRIAERWSMVRVSSSGKTAQPPPPPSEWPRLMRDDLVIPYEESDVFLQDRFAAYKLAVACVLDQPWFGYGPGGWIAAASEHSRNPLLRTFYLYLQFTHQDYLQTWIEWGLVGAVLVGFLIFGGLWRAFQRIKKEWQNTDPILIAASASLVAVLIQCMIDFPLQIPANCLYACVLTGLCWSRSRSSWNSSAIPA